MNAVFFIIFTLFLIVIQTVVLPCFSFFPQCFDLLLIDIIFLSLISSHASMIFAIILIGCAMDSISGAPFYFYIFSYLWVYIIVHIVKKMLFQRSIIFIFIMGIVSVLIQQGLMLFSMLVSQGSSVAEVDFGLLGRQAFWGFILIPPGVGLLNICFQNWIFATKLFQKQMAQKYRG